MRWRFDYAYEGKPLPSDLPSLITLYSRGPDGTTALMSESRIHSLKLSATNLPTRLFAPESLLGDMPVVRSIVSNDVIHYARNSQGLLRVSKADPSAPGPRRPALKLVYAVAFGALPIIAILLLRLLRTGGS